MNNTKRLFLTTFCTLPLCGEVPLGPLHWAFPTGGAIFSSPATCGDGRVYFGTDEGSVYCLDGSGASPELVWRFDGAADWIDSTPVVTSGGLVVFGSWDGRVYALDKDSGESVWEYQTANYIMSSAAVAATGEIIVGGGDGLLYAFSAEGDVLWIYPADDAIDASPAIADGIVYAGDSAGVLHAVRLDDGTSLWTFAVDVVAGRDPDILSSPAIGPDGTVYFGSRNHRFYALTAGGIRQWSFEAFEPIDSSPAVSPDGSVVVGSREGYLFFFDAAGVLERQVFVGDIFYASPTYDSAGNVYIAAYAGEGFSHVLAISPEGDHQWAFPVPAFNDSSPLVAMDGRLYIGMDDFNLFAFDLDGVTPGLDSWAAFRDNPRRTGRRTGYFGSAGVFRLFPRAEATADDWYWLDGFGSGWFFGKNVPWLFHPDHGHLWVEKGGAQGVWMHDSALGWLHTFSDSPGNFYFKADSAGWIYHEPGTSHADGGRWIYRYATGTWEIVPGG